MTESQLRVTLQKKIPGPDWQTIESRLVRGGIPDVNACYRGVEIWIETKMLKGWTIPRTATTVRQAQWHARRRAHGGQTFYVCGKMIRRKGRARPDLHMFVFDGIYGTTSQHERVDTLPGVRLSMREQNAWETLALCLFRRDSWRTKKTMTMQERDICNDHHNATRNSPI